MKLTPEQRRALRVIKDYARRCVAIMESGAARQQDLFAREDAEHWAHVYSCRAFNLALTHSAARRS